MLRLLLGERLEGTLLVLWGIFSWRIILLLLARLASTSNER